MVRPCLCFLVYCMQMVWSSTSASHCRWGVVGDDLVWCRELKRNGCMGGENSRGYAIDQYNIIAFCNPYNNQ